MKYELDLEKIKELSEENKEDNWGFRSFMKSGGVTSRKIDSIVHRFSKKISAKIDCGECANCCKEFKPLFTPEDLVKIAAGLKMPEAEFIDKYLDKEEFGDDYTLKSVPCPFLENNRCTVEEFKPEDCRTYPHLEKKHFISRSINVIHNCAVCPIVFNVYEELKKEIWSEVDDDFDDIY